MNKLTKEECVRVIAALVEDNSIRATVRMTGVAKNTVVKLTHYPGAAGLDADRICPYHPSLGS